eukprot:1703136-Heterocapsa_arctica.AAC.1
MVFGLAFWVLGGRDPLMLKFWLKRAVCAGKGFGARLMEAMERAMRTGTMLEVELHLDRLE